MRSPAHDGPTMHGRRLRNEGELPLCQVVVAGARAQTAVSGVSPRTARMGGRGWVRARGGVEWSSFRRPIAQGWRALRAIPCRMPLAAASAGTYESAASTQVNSLRSAGRWKPAGWYSVSVFRGRRLDSGACSATLRMRAGFADGAPKRHRPHSGPRRALNFCLIKHLQDRTGEKHYRCEARAHDGGSPIFDSR